jgi:hypothetical protein
MSGITGIAMGMTRTTVAMTGMIGVGGMEISTRTEVTHGKTRGLRLRKTRLREGHRDVGQDVQIAVQSPQIQDLSSEYQAASLW